MKTHVPKKKCRVRRPSRRDFLRNAGGGFGMLAAGVAARRARAARRRAAPNPLAPRQPHFDATAQRVIFLFMSGGPSHLELFDPKPDLQRLARPAAARVVRPGQDAARRREESSLLATRRTFRKHGQSGIEVSDLLPHIAQLRRRPLRAARLPRRQRHAPRVGLPDEHRLDPDGPAEPRRVGRLRPGHREPEHAGVRRPARPRRLGQGRRARPGATATCRPPTRARSSAAARRRSCNLQHARRASRAEQQRRTLDLINQLNREHLRARAPTTRELAARIAAYELAFRMQAHAPEVVDIAQRDARRRDGSTASTSTETAEFGLRCLLARRLVERGVRFVQLYCGDTNGWDGHSDVEGNHAKLVRARATCRSPAC